MSILRISFLFVATFSLSSTVLFAQSSSAVSEENKMAEVLELAEDAMSSEERKPFAAVVVLGGKEIGSGQVRIKRDEDVTAHAICVALRSATKKVGRVDLSGATVYASFEPCEMCASALILANVSRVVFGVSLSEGEFFTRPLLYLGKRMASDRGDRGFEVEKLGGEKFKQLLKSSERIKTGEQNVDEPAEDDVD